VTNLFVYGTLMPDEIAFPQIRALVRKVCPAKLYGSELYLRDGLPTLKIHSGEGYSHRKVNGYLLQPIEGMESELRKTVESYEGTNYRLVEVSVELSREEKVTASTFIGSKIEQSNPEPWEGDWNTSKSPLLGYGLPALITNLNLMGLKVPTNLGPSGYWREKEYWLGKGSWPGLLKIEGDYLTLTSIFEYVLSLRFGRLFGKDVMKRIDALSQDPQMIKAFARVSSDAEWGVRDVTNIGAGKASPKNLKRALDTCYTARNNLTHRGKSVKSDAETLISASKLLAQIIVYYLIEILPEIEKTWSRDLLNEVLRASSNQKQSLL